MDSEQIEYFLAVARDLNFTKASCALFVSQSAVSKKIAQLEKEIGFPLFNRGHRKITLTEHGMAFQSFFLRVQKDWEEEVLEAKRRVHKEEHTLRIGVIEGYSLTRFLVQLSDENPHCIYKIDFDRINILVKKMNDDLFDIVIGSKKGIQQALNQEKITNIHLETLKTIQRIIYFSKNNPLYKKENLSISDFKDQPFYIGKSQVARMNAEEICRKEGFEGKFEPTLNPETIEFRLQEGIGFALGDAYNRIQKDRDFAYFYIPHLQEVGIAWREDVPKTKLNYIKKIQAIFENDHSKME